MALRELTQEDIDSGELIDADEFLDYVLDGGFIDYDGFGHAVYGSEIDEQYEIVPSEVENNGLEEDITHVLWYNR